METGPNINFPSLIVQLVRYDRIGPNPLGATYDDYINQI